jgi:murein DD-endopeptidase MepM/ murein hydrolase activator NlpD
LASKKISIFLVPDSTSRVRQFRLPRFFLIFIAIFSVFSGAGLCWIINDYWAIKADMPRLAKLKSDNVQQQRQFAHLIQRIDQVTHKLNELKAFDQKLKVMVNLETGEDGSQFQGVGGSDTELTDPKRVMEKSHKEMVRSLHRSLDTMEHEIALGEEDKKELHKFLESQKILLASTPSIWPTKGWMSSRFGYRTSPFTGQKEFHKGIDISTRMNAPVIAPANGIVSHVGWNHGYGRVLTIEHGYGVKTKYAHLQKILVKKGKHVKRGETVALVGSTGRSTGPHLHYEVHLNRVAVNPLRYILN